MRRSLSRRAFLGAAGAASLVAVPKPTWASSAETAGTVERLHATVVVIGSTIGGLVAADALRRQGVSVILLHSGPVGAPADHGAAADAWLLSDHTRLLGLAREAGSTVLRVPAAGSALEGISGGARPLGDGLLSADGRVGAEVVSALTKLDRMASELDVENPWRTVNALVRDARTLGSWLDGSVAGSSARSRLWRGFELVLGASPAEASLLFALLIIASSGGSRRVLGGAYDPEFQISGGLGALTSKLAEALGDRARIADAPSVATAASGAVTVASADLAVEARRVIFASDSAVAGPVEPLGRARIAGRLALGQISRVVCSYATPFWRDAGTSGRIVGDGAPIHAVYPSPREPALVATIAGDAARNWSRLAPAERREAVVDTLSRWLGPRAATPVRYEECGGQSGSPVVAPPGALTAIGDELRAPAGAACWAGAETASSWLGHPEGEVEAGLRAASDTTRMLVGAATRVEG